DLTDMQKYTKKVVLPPDMSTLKKKIIKDFPFMKADEWKSWCLVYSPVIFLGHFPRDNLDNWMCFVNACKYLSKPIISEDELAEANFCLELFGHGYWLFSFERCNGILKKLYNKQERWI
ncbi:hypothetical protein CLU79DRAFT_697720, partial [Phycomyces nitens]